MRRSRWVVAVVVAVAVVIAVAALRRPPAEDETVQPSLSLDESSIQFVRPKVIGMQDGIRQWELETDRMREQGNLIYLEGIHRGMLYREDEEYLTFVADEGIWDRRRDQLTLTGSVVVYRDGEKLLESERIVWDGRSEILTSPGPVQLWLDDYSIRADEMIGDVNKDELLFRGNVDVASDRMMLSLPDQLVYRVEDGSMSGVGPGTLQIMIRRENG